jgi:hypothetical protein
MGRRYLPRLFESETISMLVRMIPDVPDAKYIDGAAAGIVRWRGSSRPY